MNLNNLIEEVDRINELEKAVDDAKSKLSGHKLQLAWRLINMYWDSDFSGIR
jgi:hypothetical protein